jgi:uncharacterized protein YbjT (DUF2867 family)
MDAGTIALALDMNVVIFGATGMVGQGVLRECLLDPDVRRVVTVGRSSVDDPKVRDLVVPDLFDLTAIESDLTNLDACFFCLGVSSAGMSEADYARVTFDLTMSIANTLARLNPQMTFVFISGAGTDSSEGGRTMWARVKGRAENALLQMPFKAAYMFRPAFIQPLHGIRSKTTLYQFFYTLLAPMMPLLRRMPRWVTTTERLGRAMIAAAKHGAPKRILESEDINQIATGIR